MVDTLPSPELANTPARKRRSRPWHRVLGVMTTLPLIWVMVTGGLLNHTVDWKLDQIQLSHPWLLRAYGMAPAGEPIGLEIAGRQVAGWDGQVFLDHQSLELAGKLIGAVPDGDGLAIITPEKVLRIDAGGEVIESLDSISLPATPLTGSAPHEGRALLKNADGWHRADANWLEFTPVADAPFAAQALSTLENQDSIERLRKAWTRGGLPASRVILDLHAGHFLGPFARYFYDIVVICTLWLCATGLILFFRTPRRKR